MISMSKTVIMRMINYYNGEENDVKGVSFSKYDENNDDYYSDYYNLDQDADNNNICKTCITPISLHIIQAQTRNKQNHLVWQKSSLEHGTAEILGGKVISNKYVFNFLRKVSIVSTGLITIGS